VKTVNAHTEPPHVVVSDRVKFHHQGRDWHGTIAKKGRTYAVVILDDAREFRVPYTQVEKLPDAAPRQVSTRSDAQRARFTTGDRVCFDFRGLPIQGVITRLNPQRAHIVADDGREYRASYASLQNVAENLTPVTHRSTDLDAVAQLARGLLVQHDLSHWSFQFDNGRKRAGCCHYGTKVISLSYEFAKHAPEDEIRDTILHEIAHALVGQQYHHDDVWRAQALEIGCSGQRCHDLQFTLPRYIVSCAQGCWVATTDRRRSHVLCRQCRGQIVYQTFTEERWQQARRDQAAPAGSLSL
jgi:predicted SprT family Zn-dependent metalloprotease